jgi:hypothetical protein
MRMHGYPLAFAGDDGPRAFPACPPRAGGAVFPRSAFLRIPRLHRTRANSFARLISAEKRWLWALGAQHKNRSASFLLSEGMDLCEKPYACRQLGRCYLYFQ